MCMKFRTFWNKEDWYPSLIITEIYAPERDVYSWNLEHSEIKKIIVV